ncbi:energy transducer TonB [Saccharicrinis sp. FJH54]|uniref:energy transducer TonB n=1 Tax=Saccharicrinis sp. FJH54 TaxID=3344665 RepID=UPI0035D3DE19
MIIQYKSKIIGYRLFLVTGLMLLALSAYGQKLKKVKQKLPDNVIEEFHVLKSNPEIKEGAYKREDKLNGQLTEGFFHNNKKNKIWSFYELNPKNKTREFEIRMGGTYVDGVKDNLWFYINFKNSVLRKEFYTLGVLDSVLIYDEFGSRLKKKIFYYNTLDSVIFQYNSKSKPVYVYDSRSDKILHYYYYTNPPMYKAKVNDEWTETELDFPPLLINCEKLQNYYNSLIKSQKEEKIVGPIIKGTIDETGRPMELVFIDSVRFLNGHKFLIHHALSDSIMLFLKSNELKWMAGHKDGYPVSAKFLYNTRTGHSDISDNLVCYKSKAFSEFIMLDEATPSFPGGKMAMMNYLNNTTHFPKEAKNKAIHGRVWVKFVVTKKGIIKNVKVMRGVHPLLDKEAVRVIKSMPKWVPGKIKGKPANTNFMLPINFVLK